MRVKAIVIRIVKQFLNDKRTLGLIFLAPLLVLVLTNLILAENTYVPSIAVVVLPQHIEALLLERATLVQRYPDRNSALEALENQEVDAFLEHNGQKATVILEGTNPTANKVTLHLLSSLGQSSTPAAALEVQYLYGTGEMTLFDEVGSALIGFLVFFFVFITAGVSFLRERTTGTLERLLGTPIKRHELVLGYILGFGVFTSLQAIVVSLFAVKILNVTLAGSMLWLIIVTQLLAMAALTLGMLLSSFAHNEFQIVQLIPVVIIPQFLFAGLFSLDSVPALVQVIGNIAPMKYGAAALRQIMLRGKSWPVFATDIYALLAFSVIIGAINVVALKKYRSV